MGVGSGWGSGFLFFGYAKNSSHQPEPENSYFFRGHSIHTDVPKSTIAITRSSGKNGVRNVSTNPTPSREAGRTMHAGQKRVKAPSRPAIPLALFTPRGQLPIFAFQKASPDVSESSNARMRVKTISAVFAGGRRSQGAMFCKSPSCHAKNAPVPTSVTPKGIQKKDERRTRFIDFVLRDRRSFRRRPVHPMGQSPRHNQS